MITKEQVIEAQNVWGAGVVKIGSLKDSRLECESFTSEFLDKLYSFENGPVLFKPTKCADEQFRPTKSEAKSYFIAGDDRACNEDKGLDMLLAVPNIPQPIPNVKSRCPSFFEATIYSEENKPVPAISLSPKATAGKIYVSFFIRAFKSKPLSFKD